MNKSVVTKPISSPGRTTTEKFPPPLMSFLRTNNGSKNTSRRRSRANPLFFKKKTTLLLDTQEPSSPKVTCIGQVRVRRSKKTKKIPKKTTAAAAVTTTTVRRRHHHHNHRRSRLCRCLKWVLFFPCGSCRNYSKDSQENQEQKEEYKYKNKTTVNSNIQGLTNPQSTPRNALLLTRCRSAPYSSSSLGSIFRESRVEIEGEGLGISDGKMKTLKIEELEEDKGRVNGVDKKINGGLMNEEEEGSGTTCSERKEEEGVEGVVKVPLILTRCKSEPATTWDDQLLV